MKRKLNTWTVSGLMIGPILGSGIVFLPPLAYRELGAHAIWAWAVMMALGALFAWVFAKMTILAPSNEGVSAIIGSALGSRFRVLSANLLTGAVLFGPVAVAITAADFLAALFPGASGLAKFCAAAAVLALCALLTACGASVMSRSVLVLSSATAILLLAGSVATLLTSPAVALPNGMPDVPRLGRTLLLIFWSIVGWEVLGNYVEEVENPARTMLRAMKLSLAAIVSVYLLTAFALQNAPEHSMAALLAPLFGQSGTAVISLLAAGLCVCTIVTFTGAVVRQTAARLQRTQCPSPLRSQRVLAAVLLAVNLAMLAAHALGLLGFEQIVAAANALFICNALLGLLGGFKLICNVFVRIGIGILIAMLLALLAFSPLYALAIAALVTAASVFFKPGMRKAEPEFMNFL